jgi:hypothetical protein
MSRNTAKLSAPADTTGEDIQTMQYAGSCRFVLAALWMFASNAACGDEDFNRADSLKSPALLCITDSPMRSAICDAPEFAAPIKAVQTAATGAIARARPVTMVLLKRDQVWFRDTIESYNENATVDDSETKEKITAILQQRVAVLNGIA